MAALVHLYGPVFIHGYGITICIGLLISVWRATKHPWCRQYIGTNQFIDLISWAVVAGIIGGRALYVATEWHTFDSYSDILAFWDGGFSVLGTVVGELCFLPWYSWKHAIPYFPTIDLCATYAPLLQSISRLGCFWAGCCGGIVSTMPWAIINDELQCYAHPVQLYSALTLFGIFIFMRYYIPHRFQQPGQLIAWYLICIGIERATIDLWRTDHYACIFKATISLYQIISVGIGMIGLMALIYTILYPRRPYEHI